MKKLLMIILLATTFSTMGCSQQQEEAKEIQVAGREQEFFNIDVYYKENAVSWSKDGIQQVWVVDISPKSSEYMFSAYSDMEIEITYSCTRQDTGEFKSNEKMWIDVEYDENGYLISETFQTLNAYKAPDSESIYGKCTYKYY